MSSTSETGHAKNVYHFEQLISFCTGFGAAYSPTKTALSIISLNSLHTAAKAQLQNVIDTTIVFNNIVNKRMDTFAPMRTLATRLVNAFTVSDATKEMIKDARTINRKIQGQRALTNNIPLDPSTPAPMTISTSQQSYDKLIEHFATLVALLKSEPSYAPTETELTIPELDILINRFRTDNTNVMNAHTQITLARSNRNSVLYTPGTGLVDIALAVKTYIKAAFGTRSDQYIAVKSIAFRNRKL